MPFFFATKSLQVELGWDNVCHVLVSYLPIPGNIGEMKTKPTQQAIKMLTETGIFPDFVLCRATNPLDEPRKKKIQIYANIPTDHVISAPDVNTIYSVPLNFENDSLGEKLLKRMNIKPKKIPDWKKWRELINRIQHPSRIVNVVMVGKYVDIGDFTLRDSYISINQALEHAGAELDVGVRISWLDSKKFESNPKELEILKNYSGIIIPGGFGSSGVEGKINTIRFARENNIPFLGLCYGMQLAVVEYARNVCSMTGANTTEVNPNTIYSVIDILPSQKKLMEESRYGGTMRLGAYAAALEEDSLILNLYKKSGRLQKDMMLIKEMKITNQEFRIGRTTGDNIIFERHRHRYEVNPKFIDAISKKGLVFSGFHQREDGEKLMEFIELPNHKFFAATQAHPEFKSRLGDAAPLFLGFVKACMK
jgi:CTP synthase